MYKLFGSTLVDEEVRTGSFQDHSSVMCLRLPSDKYFLYSQSPVLQSTEFCLLPHLTHVVIFCQNYPQKPQTPAVVHWKVSPMIGLIPWKRIPEISDSKQNQKHRDTVWECCQLQGWHFLLQNKIFIGVLLDWWYSNKINSCSATC